ncbi:rCG63045 [Rattus norvegicus]|uniref:RCG63045 n=1 Tax=Rattus norvegicus TaxID=10116 RepID=A6HW51_RAT|nr:rCG63045 [Rattus norvegicus]
MKPGAQGWQSFPMPSEMPCTVAICLCSVLQIHILYC